MTDFGREYGEGLYSLCAEEGLALDVLQEMRCLKEEFHRNPDFIRLLGNMSMPKQERVQIVHQALNGQIHGYLLNFIKILVERGAMHSFADCLEAYSECYNREHQVAEAEVTTARPLDDAQRARLMARLKEMTGKEVVLREKIDSSVLGGVLLQMDGKRYDNTVKHRLDAIRQTMVGE